MLDYVPLQPVDYLVIGHVTQDLTPDGLRLGRHSGIFHTDGACAWSTSWSRDLRKRKKTSMKALDGIQVISIPSEHTTTFENIYTESGRRQILHHQAEHISFELVPEVWRSASIIHLGPVAQELDSELPKKFSPSLLGVTPQGWMRTWNDDGRIVPCKWQNAEPILPKAGAVVISREDVGGDEELIEINGASNAHIGRHRSRGGGSALLERRPPPLPHARSRGSGCDRRRGYFCIGLFHPFASNARSMGSRALCHPTLGAVL